MVMKTLATIFIVGLNPAFAEPPKTPEQACREYLIHLPDVYFASTGTQIEFTGQFTPGPPALQADLTKHFPELSFHIANMTFLHWGPEPVHLLLVVSKRTNRVCTFLWDLWFTREPISFRAQFGRDRRNPDTAKDRMAALASLLAFQMGWTAGEVSVSDGVVTAPLIATNNNGDRTLQLKLNPDLGEMAFDIVPLQAKGPAPK